MNRAFIYFRYTPKSVKFITSYDLSPLGVGKAPIKQSDPNWQTMDTIVLQVINAIKYRFGNSPRADIQWLPQQGKFGQRIYVKFSGE